MPAPLIGPGRPETKPLLPNPLARFLDRYGVFLFKTHVFVYQMGKVGSSAIEEGLREGGVSVRHLHSIGGDFSDQFRFRRAGRSLIARLRRRLEGSMQGLLLNVPNRRVKVITLTREPISRNISAFFQAFRKIMWDYREFDSRHEAGGGQVLVDAFYQFVQQETPMLWFDQEIRRRLGIDVFQHPFNHEQGWIQISQGNVDLLLLRMEDLSRCESVIGSFVGLPGFKLKNDNCGERKWYAPLYRSFRSHFSPAPELLARLYATRYMRHFYSAKEIAAFRDRWINQPGNPAVPSAEQGREVPAGAAVLVEG